MKAAHPPLPLVSTPAPVVDAEPAPRASSLLGQIADGPLAVKTGCRAGAGAKEARNKRIL